MANKFLELAAVFKDHLSGKADKASRSVKGLSKNTQTASISFKEFNRTLFATTAFIGTFTAAFTRFSGLVQEGAETNRLVSQFEKAFGPRSLMLQDLQKATNTTIDQMTFMREALSLKGLGIETNYNKIRDILVKSGIAAKKAGVNSAEGMSHFAEFLKTGSVANLSFLNLLPATNLAFKAQIATLEKAGGVLGGVVSTQHKLNFAMKLLNNLVSESDLKERDLLDTTTRLSQAIKFFKADIGAFIGKEFEGFIDKISKSLEGFSSLIDRIKESDKTFLKTVGRIISVSGAMIGLIGAFGSLKLILTLLGKIGLGGIPLVATLLTGLSMSLMDNMNPLESVARGIKNVSSVLFGASQVIFSFLGDSKNFGEGVGYMDKKLADFLKQRGLLDLTVTVSRAGAVMLAFSRDVLKVMIGWIKSAVDAADSLYKSISSLLGLGSKAGLSKGFFGEGGFRNLLVKGAAGGILGYGALKLLGITKLIPGLGGLFKLFGEKKPKGTPNDPIYTKSSLPGGFSVGSPTTPESLISGKTLQYLGLVAAISAGLYQIYLLIKNFSTVKSWWNAEETSKKTSAFESPEYKELNQRLTRMGIVIPSEKLIEAAQSRKNSQLSDKEFYKQKAVELAIGEGMYGSANVFAGKNVDTSQMPKTSEERTTAMKNTLSELHGESKRVFKTAFDEALKDNKVTYEEMYNAYSKALDNSYLSQAKKQERAEKRPGSVELSLGKC